MKIKISNHNKKKYEINEILRIVKAEISVVQTQYNELFKIQRVREDKEKQRKKKKIVTLSEFEKFFSIDEKSRSDFKTRSLKHSDLSIFFEHKKLTTFEYIRYDI